MKRLRITQPLLALTLATALTYVAASASNAQDAPAAASNPSPPPTTSDADVGLPDEEVLKRIDAELNTTVGPGWMISYRAGKAKAIAENKDLVLLFTGSDWIPLCETFDKDIINNETFFAMILKRFVPVRFDFTKKLKQSDALKAQNQVLMANYRVQGLPTVLLTDSSGLPYAVNGYQVLSAKEYGAIITALQAVRLRRDEKFAAAETAQGLEKAQLLADGIPTLPGNLAAWFYRPEMVALIANDLQNKTGKAVHYQRLLNDVAYSRTMAELSRNVEWAKMIGLTDDYIRGNQLKGEELQHAMMNKIGIFQSQGKYRDMAQTLLEIVAIDPKSTTGVNAQTLLDQMRVNTLKPDPVDKPGTSEEIKP